MQTIFPGERWEQCAAEDAGFDAAKLDTARRWLEEQSTRREDGRYRVAVVRGGRLIAEWNHGVGGEEALRLASATKSIFSSLLAVAVDEGVIPSPDARVVDFYPEMMDVPNGAGPKAGRYAFEKDRAITFRQLISNTSGYMKPGEEPGRVFNYQTYGMNILTHAIAKSYGLYNAADPEGSPGVKELIDSRIRQPIGAHWGYYLANFDLHAQARLSIFGYYEGVASSALDMARLGWLWRHWGRWRDQQLIPEAWLREATKVAPDIRRHCAEAEWVYGYGFWTNEFGRLWPNLPRDSYAASGAGRQHIWVSPDLDLVIVQSPGLYEDQRENDSGLVRLIVDAVVA
ncbi:MAG: serine hydrolase [Caldilineaceae bacterium]|nr:serine hydrolase [Caldilineaceae bacterium]